MRVWASGTAFRHGWPAAKCPSKQRPGPWGQVCFRCGPVALCFVTVGLRPNAPQSSAPALGAGVLRVRAKGTAFRHGWPAAKCSSKQRPRPLGRVRCECGPRALRFVTVGLRPNAPQSSAPALGGGGALGVGHGHCISSRLACGQMFLKAAPPGPWGGCVAGAGQWHCVSSRLAFGQMLLKAAPRPLGRVCFGCEPRALRFVTVGLRPNVPQSSAPARGTRVNKQVFHKEYSQC